MRAVTTEGMPIVAAQSCLPSWQKTHLLSHQIEHVVLVFSARDMPPVFRCNKNKMHVSGRNKKHVFCCATRRVFCCTAETSFDAAQEIRILRLLQQKTCLQLQLKGADPPERLKSVRANSKFTYVLTKV